MKLTELFEMKEFQVVNRGDLMDRDISKPFCCDLLSIAMSKAPVHGAWITVMGNVNTIAVAALTDVACIILAEGILLDPVASEKAKEQGITVLATELPIFEASLKVYEAIHG